ncbi:MAG: amino acid permease [Thermoanaerobaculia bacterium]
MTTESGYRRRLSLFDSTMVVIGGIIGAGIFLSPSIVAQRVDRPGQIMLAWVVGGAVALVGALCFGELGARRPLAGGGYVYLRETFGELPAFLYGWTQLLVINSGGIAAVAIIFAGYACGLLGLGERGIKPLAVTAIVVLSIVNYLGIRPGSITQNILTILKLLALAGVIGAGLWALAGEPAELGGAIEHHSSDDAGMWKLLGIALIPVLFSYGGWQHANHIGGEIRSPGKNLPRALLLGVATVVFFYVLTNVAYLSALGVDGLAASSTPAADTLVRMVGPAGGKLISLGIVFSTLGFVNLVILAAPRIYQTMAADGLFFGWVAQIHPRYRTPSGAIVFQGTWAAALALSGTYAQLLDYVVFGDWIFFGLVVATLFVYRRRQDGNVTDFQTPGYPLTPLIFVATAAYVVVSSILWNPLNALLGASLIALGIPVFLFWRRRRG